MKPIFLTIILLTSSFSFCQNKKEILSDIHNKYQVIKELMSKDALRQYNTGYTFNISYKKSPLTFYYNGNELKYIEHIYTWGHTTYKDEFYVWDDQLFFQYTTQVIRYKDYRKKGVIKSDVKNITLTLEDRFYFKNRKAIKCQFKSFQNHNDSIKITTHRVRNITTECDLAENVLEKFDILKKLQAKEVESAKELPKSISKTYQPNLNHTAFQQN
ncbi:hypothetical protein ABW636_11990 [Aquimarina sp. 2201CG1-2-11]|uniref:hypothetical protein n=1 Tax=Aquimarina discodermiae TaxID=3231043 RepID=UPI0034624F39